MTNKDSICLEDNKNKKTTQERGDEERRKTRQQQQQPRCVFEEKKERRNRIHPSIQYQEKTELVTMAMRDLITGATACPDPSASSSSANPLGALANVLVGSSSKTQVPLLQLFTHHHHHHHC